MNDRLNLSNSGVAGISPDDREGRLFLLDVFSYTHTQVTSIIVTFSLKLSFFDVMLHQIKIGVLTTQGHVSTSTTRTGASWGSHSSHFTLVSFRAHDARQARNPGVPLQSQQNPGVNWVSGL